MRRGEGDAEGEERYHQLGCRYRCRKEGAREPAHHDDHASTQPCDLTLSASPIHELQDAGSSPTVANQFFVFSQPQEEYKNLSTLVIFTFIKGYITSTCMYYAKVCRGPVWVPIDTSPRDCMKSAWLRTIKEEKE